MDIMDRPSLSDRLRKPGEDDLTEEQKRIAQRANASKQEYEQQTGENTDEPGIEPDHVTEAIATLPFMGAGAALRGESAAGAMGKYALGAAEQQGTKNGLSKIGQMADRGPPSYNTAAYRGSDAPRPGSNGDLVTNGGVSPAVKELQARLASTDTSTGPGYRAAKEIQQQIRQMQGLNTSMSPR